MNAGVDMMMIPDRKDFQGYIEGVKAALNNKTLTMDRLNDAVAKVVAVKLALGTAKLQKSANMRFANEEQHSYEEIVRPEVQANTQYQDSLQAVHESLVLLKNANVLPVKTSALEYIALVGEKIININNLAKNELFLSYDNIGMQSGGWSVRWQGFEGNSMWKGESKTASNASSILDGLKSLNQGVTIDFIVVSNDLSKLYYLHRKSKNRT